MHEALVKRSSADRRKDRRFPMRGAIDVRATGIDLDIHATLEDISSGGCRIGARVPLQMKHPVRVALPRPGQPELRVTGNVVRAYGNTTDRIYHYGIRFRIESDEARADIRKYVSLYAHRLSPLRAETSDRRGSSPGVEVKVPVDVFVPEIGRMLVVAISLRTEGMRVASDRILRQEWNMKIDLRFPSEVAGPSSVVTVAAKALPGVREVRGQFVQDLVFVDPSLRVRGEIERFLYELRLADTRGAGRSRNP